MDKDRARARAADSLILLPGLVSKNAQWCGRWWLTRTIQEGARESIRRVQFPSQLSPTVAEKHRQGNARRVTQTSGCDKLLCHGLTKANERLLRNGQFPRRGAGDAPAPLQARPGHWQ